MEDTTKKSRLSTLSLPSSNHLHSPTTIYSAGCHCLTDGQVEQQLTFSSYSSMDESRCLKVLHKEPTKRNASTSTPLRMDDELDGGYWAWIVVLGSFLTNGIIFSIVNCYGILFKTIQNHFKTGDDNFDNFWTSSIGSVCVGMLFLFSLPASILTDCIGVRKTAVLGGTLATLGLFLTSFATDRIHIWISYGLLFGIGSSLCYTPSLVILGHYFEKRLGVVNGVVTAGSSIFSIIMSLSLGSFVKTASFQHIFWILTGLISLLILCGLTFIERTKTDHSVEIFDDDYDNHGRRLSQDDSGIRVSPPSSTSNPSFGRRVRTSIFRREIWSNSLYIFWVIAVPIGLFGYFVPFFNVVKHFASNVPDVPSSIPITAITAASGLGRIIFGVIADIPWINRVFLQQIAFIMIGLLTLGLFFANDFISLLVICVGLGLFDGCFISVLSPIAFDLVGREHASQAVGTLLALCAVPLTVGPMVAGVIIDVTKSHTWAFLYAGIPPIIGAILMLPVLRGMRNRTRIPLRPSPSFSETGVSHGLTSSAISYLPSTQTSRSDIPNTPNEDLEEATDEEGSSTRTQRVFFGLGQSSSQEEEDVFDAPPTYDEVVNKSSSS